MIRTRTVQLLVGTLLAASSMAGCSTNPSTGRTQLLLLPSSQVAAMGAEAKPQLVQEYGGEVESSRLREYIDEVGRRVAQNVEPEFSDIAWEFIVLDSEVINAFALPGGYVFLSRGLLELFDNEAQVAGVLGHEIGHVTARHVDERLSQALVAQFGLEVVGAMTESQLASVGTQLLVQGTMLKFGRDQESEADSQGVKYMTLAGYDPRGMVEVLEVLDAASSSGGPPEILSTHPLPKTRIDRVRALIDEHYAYTRGDPGYRKFTGRYERRAKPFLRSQAGPLRSDEEGSLAKVVAATP